MEKAAGATKRGRGRPPGEGKRDTPYLERAADLCVADPSMKPTTAMKRIMRTRNDWGSSDETLLRRWQVKWKGNAAALLSAARDRADARHAVVVKPTPPRSWMEIMEMVRTSPVMKLLEDVRRATENSPFLRIMAQLDSSPMMKVARQWENSPALKLLKQIEESPTIKLARQMESSAMMKYAEQISPVLKFAQQKNQSLDLSKFQSIMKSIV